MSRKELKLKLKIKSENFEDFVNKLSIVSSIDDTVMVKIDSSKILIYSMINGGSIILAFKSFLLNTSDIFSNDIDYTMNLIIPNCKKFVKNLQFVKDLDKVDFDLNCREDNDILNVRSFKITSGKFKVNWMGGDPSSIRDMTRETLDKFLDIRNRKWEFSVGIEDFTDIKKLSGINDEKIISIDVSDGKVLFSERASWELEVDSIETNTASLIFNKRFFKCINDKVDKVTFNIFENFMLIKDSNSNLLLSFEQTFDDDDE